MLKDTFSSIQEDILRISLASSKRDHWGVLGIPAGSNYKQIKAAHRKWLRKLHPDRWFASTDESLYREINEAFYQVQVAYFEALKHTVIPEPDATFEPITMPSEGTTTPHETGFFAWLRRILKKLPFLSVARRNPRKIAQQ